MGKGKAVYYGSFFNLDSARYLIRRYADEHQLRPIFSGLPKEVEVTRRTKDGIHYYFLLNHADESVTVKPGAGYFDLLAGKEALSSFVLRPFEYKVLKRSVEWPEKTR
jgi:beta-galactosidase GanA